MPGKVVSDLKAGRVNPDHPAVTLALLQADAVLGVKGVVEGGKLESIGITCAVCHSTVDDSLAPSIAHRLDGWSSQDLNVGAIVGLSPNLQALADVLSKGGTPVDVATVRQVLASRGPGKDDAELNLDVKAFRPDAGKAKCATCHVPPLFTEPCWAMHTAAELASDDFQAKRSPDERHRTPPLKGLWTHMKRGFYHDGRFQTLLDVVDHYDSKGIGNGGTPLGLTAGEKAAFVEYLKSL